MNAKQQVPAFPTVDANREADYGTTGMTLRDYFAAKAINALLQAATNADFDIGENWRPAMAVSAYQLADAMLKAREVQS